MHVEIMIIALIFCALCLYTVCILLRMFRVHHGAGTFVLLRQHGGRHWLHARIFYTPEGLRYITHNYKLKSGIIDRASIELLPNPEVDCNAFLEKTVPYASCKLQTHSFSYDIASTLDTVTALQSWIESSPSIRQVPRPHRVQNTKFYSRHEI